MTLTQIEVFAKIVELGSFTKAGDELGMTQSSVSHSISKLENHLNVKLFNRLKNNITLTPIGKSIYIYAQEILKNIDFINFEANNSINLPAQTLKVGSFQSISMSLLPKVIKLFKEIYPQINFIIFEGTEEEIIHWLKTDAIDLGFITIPSNEFDTVYIIQDEISVVVSKNHKLAKLNSIKIQQIKDEDLIMPTHDCNILMTRDTKHLLADVKYRISNFNTILEMVREQLGITIFPNLITNNISNERITSISFTPPFYRNIGIASKENISDNLLKRTFVEKTKYIVQLKKLD